MEHLHTQIAVAVSLVMAGSDVSTINGRTFLHRVYPSDVSELPYACVWVPMEEIQVEAGDGGGDTFVQAEVAVMVALFFDEEEAGLEPAMNAGLMEAQMALAPGIELTSGHVDLDYRGCEKAYESGDMPYGQVLLKFIAEIAYAKGDPTELAWR